MKIAQIYSLMLLLINNKKLTREYAAERLNVSERTVQRYIDTLAEAGVPVTIVQGRKGGYSIADDFKMPCTLFTPEEVERITTSINALSHSFGDELGISLIQKLESVSEGGKLYNTPSILVDAGAWNNPEALRGKMDVVAAAIDQRITLSIDYRDKFGQPTKREIDPYCMVLKEGMWYVYGWCHTRSEFRIFRLARMRTIDLTNNVFNIRDGADVKAALSSGMNSPILVRIEFDEHSLARVEEWVGEDAIKFDGTKYTASIMTNGGETLVGKILSLGDGVTVVSPDSVKSDILKAIKTISEKYNK